MPTSTAAPRNLHWNFICLLTWIFLIHEGIASAQPSELPRQYQPMYGGLQPDEAKRLLSNADRTLLNFGPSTDPDGVSASWIRTGMKSYYKGEYNTAIRAFNFAWLTKPTNSNALAAFGIAVGARDGACAGAPLIQNAVKGNPIDAAIAIDAVATIASCITQPDYSQDEKTNSLHCSSIKHLLETPEIASTNRTASQFEITIVSLTLCADYEGAWRQVEQMRRLLGRGPRTELLDTLRSLSPEP